MQSMLGTGTPNTPANPQSPDATEPKKKNIFEKLFGGGNKTPQPAPSRTAAVSAATHQIFLPDKLNPRAQAVTREHRYYANRSPCAA